MRRTLTSEFCSRCLHKQAAHTRPHSHTHTHISQNAIYNQFTGCRFKCCCSLVCLWYTNTYVWHFGRIYNSISLIALGSRSPWACTLCAERMREMCKVDVRTTEGFFNGIVVARRNLFAATDWHCKIVINRSRARVFVWERVSVFCALCELCTFRETRNTHTIYTIVGWRVGFSRSTYKI